MILKAEPNNCRMTSIYGADSPCVETSDSSRREMNRMTPGGEEEATRLICRQAHDGPLMGSPLL